MPSNEPNESGLTPTADPSENVKKSLAWASKELSVSPEVGLELWCDFIRHLRELQAENGFSSQDLAKVVHDAAAAIELLQGIRPGGMSVDEFQKVCNILKFCADHEIEVSDLLEKTTLIDSAGAEKYQEATWLIQSCREGNFSIKDVMSAKALIDEFGGDLERIRKASEYIRDLAERGMDEDKVARFFDFHEKLEKLRFTGKSALTMAEALTKAQEQGGSVEEAADLLIFYTEKVSGRIWVRTRQRRQRWHGCARTRRHYLV